MEKKTIKIAKKKLNQIIKEYASKVLSETVSNTYFDSYEDFLSFLNNTDVTMEYYYVSKDKSCLSVDLYIDDCASYKRYNHPLWMYFCDGYSHDDELVPISISYSPQIMIRNYTTNLPSVEISRITQFIKDNQNIIQDIADERINSIEFVNRIKYRPRKLCVEKVDRSINEMAKIENYFSNLGFDIYIDASPRTTNHKEYRLKYPINRDMQQGNNSGNFTPMSICENPDFLPPSKIEIYNQVADTKRKRIMQTFIKEHYKELQEISDGIRDLDEYKVQLKQSNSIKKT